MAIMSYIDQKKLMMMPTTRQINSLANIEDNKVTPENVTVNNEEKRHDEQNINIVPTQVDKNAR